MRAFVSLITSLAFVLHVGLGCCLHHAHAAHETGCQHSTAANQATSDLAAQAPGHSHAGHDHHRAEQSHESPTPDSCPAGECEGGKCVFVSISKVNLSSLANVFLLPITANETLDVLALSSAMPIWDSGGLVPLPIRLHLYHQILLI